SHERRRDIEEALKAGRLRAVVATSSLELGIDMGAVDLVVQVEAPGSTASGLQRIGRAGHQVGAVSEGVFFPKHLGDLLAMAAVVERMRAGRLETTAVLENPLDVLAQQIVAMTAMEPWAVDDLHAVLRRSAPFARLSRPVLESVLDLLAGRYPSDAFAELRPRLDWDRAQGRLTPRRGAQRLAVTSGGTIPDRGLYGVFLADGSAAGRRVGELDEEMVFESRGGDTITLGSSSWLITGITADQVLVEPAPGAPGRLPFWKGDGLGRRAELGAAVGALARELQAADDEAARTRLAGLGLDAWAADNLLAYLADQRTAAGAVPDDRTIVVESFRDELGDWRIVVCCPLGGRVNTPWSLLIAHSLRQAYGLDIQAMATDDGIVFRLPDTAAGWDDDAPAAWARDGLTAHLLTDPDRVEDLVRAQLADSPHFAVRFREAAARALLLPRRQPGRRQPLWQLRNRSAQLLSIASAYPEFPIMLEATRECLRDDFELAALSDLMARLARREARIVEVTTERPSPFARTVLFNYVGLFMYEADTPLAELRAAALTVDATLLAELLGGGAGLDPADLIDPAVLTRVEAELQCLTESRQARSAEDAHDLIRRLGPISEAALAARTRPDTAAALPTWLAGLETAGQIHPLARPDPTGPGPADPNRLPAPFDGQTARAGRRWVAASDAPWVAAALGLPPPAGLPPDWSAPADPVPRAILRYARTHGPFTTAECAAWLGLPPAALDDDLTALAAAGRLTAGRLRPTSHPDDARTYCDPDVFTQLRRRSLAKLRAAVEPVPQPVYARFLADWHGIGDDSQRGLDGLRRAIEQLAGAPVPASALETFVLPARVADYEPGHLDELLAAGEAVWCGRGELAGGDGWVTLLPADLTSVFPAPPPAAGAAATSPTANPPTAPGGLPPPAEAALEAAILDVLAGGGAFRVSELTALVSAALGTPPRAADVTAACWRLAWGGLTTTDTLAPLRERLGQVRPTVRARRPPPRVTTRRPRLSLARLAPPPTTAAAGGRWSLVPGQANHPAVAARRGADPAVGGRPPTPPAPPRTAHPTPATRERRGGPAAFPPHGPGIRQLGTAKGLTGRAAGETPSLAGELPQHHGVPARNGESDQADLPHPEFDLARVERDLARAEVLLDRHGVLTRGAVRAEDGPDGFAALYRILSLAEEQGRVRRGYFVDRLGGSQFATAGAVDRLRAALPAAPAVVVLAAADPANPYGAALPWPPRPDSGPTSPGQPETVAPLGPPDAEDPADGRVPDPRGHRPARKAGALVVLAAGDLAAYIERGGRTILTWPVDPATVTAAAQALAETVRAGRLDGLTVAAIDGRPVLTPTPPGGPQPDRAARFQAALRRAGFVLGPHGLRLRR
ncbi:MAG: hypothetical protein LBH76_05145, partial [Propionibacteriaceae bacterium]|nr:hypothetical protein [Propionibacteriaceae bacterium]